MTQEHQKMSEKPKTKKLKRKCQMCKRPLVLIGIERENGKFIRNRNGKDWDSRKYHKKCYKDIMIFHQMEEQRIKQQEEEIEFFNKTKTIDISGWFNKKI